MSLSPKQLCELCEQVISEVVTSSTIPGVTEMVGNAVVCSECFDEERGEFQ
jgi:hypothetical protein